MKRPVPFHPVLIALFPVLALYSRNMALLPYATLVRPALIILAATIAAWLLVGLIVRDWRRGATAASVFTLLCFTFGPIVDVIRSWLPYQDDGNARNAVLPFWIGAIVLAVALSAWRWKGADGLTKFFNIAGLTLFAFNGYSILSGALEIQRSVQGLKPPSVASGVRPGQRPPDIYYIILDGCGRTDALEEFLHFSNRGFIEDLERRGFFVASRSHSNYCQTELSIASSLNLDYLQTLLPRLDGDSESRAPFEELIEQNGVVNYLKSKGYLYVAITTGFPGIRTGKADVNLTATQGPNLLESSLIGRTPFKEPSWAMKSAYEYRHQTLLKAFENLEQLGPEGPRPRFVFAHILAPHPPFVFGPDGEMRRPKGMPFGFWDANSFMTVGGTREQYIDGYRDQLIYVQKRILKAVDAILDHSAQRPIILIQGDHGSKVDMDQDILAKTDVRECFRNLSSYLVPEDVRKNLYPEITPVNSFRLIFNELFDAKLPKLPDRSYYSPYSFPQRLTEVTDEIEDSPRNQPSAGTARSAQKPDAVQDH